MTQHKRIIALLLVTVVFALTGQEADAKQFIIKDGEPNAEIVVAEVSPRMVSFAALELQYYLKKISGAKVPIVFEKSDSDNIKIYVGESKYTDELGIDANDLKYGAFRMVSGKDYLVLLGHDFDYHPPKPYATKRSLIKEAIEKWDKKTENYTDLKWGSPITGIGFKNWWKPNSSANWISFNEFMENRYGKENRKVWNPADKEWEREWGKDYYEGLKNGYTPGFWKSDEGGSLNAVYAFLRQLGARWYMPAEIGEVIPELKTIALPTENKVEKPDFAIRYWLWYNYGSFPFEHVMWARRLGINTPFERFGYVGHAHGLTAVHARKEMQDKHPEYYALWKGERVTDYRGRGHVCFSSQGFFNETVNFCRFMFDEYDAPHVSLWPMDGFRHCQCEECKKLSSSDLVWGFVDRVARELYKTHPDRIVSCGAYTPYINPPSNVEKFTPNVAVLIANARRPSFDDPVKWNDYKTRVEGWKKKVAKGMIMRVENNRYHIWGKDKILFPIIHPRNMAKDLKYLNGYCLGEANEESQTGGRWAAPGCDHLTLYVNARFLWDADQDIEKVLDDYYEKFYGPAAEKMKAALEFAEAKYGRRTRSQRRRGKLDPQNVPLPTRIKLLETLHKARDVAGDSIYGKRIDVILGELPDLEKVREECALLRRKGNPRDDALQVEADNLNRKDEVEANAKSYKLGKKLWRGGRPDVGTTFTVNWTEKSLVFNVRCEEPDMKSVKIGDKVWEGDSVVLLLESPYHSYYQIEVSPDGRIFDADRAGYVVTRWKSMADVKIEKGKDYWEAEITVPIAIIGEEGAEGDPMNYVVSSRLKPGQDWFFNLARRRPRKGASRATYVLSKGAYEIHVPNEFAKLIIK